MKTTTSQGDSLSLHHQPHHANDLSKKFMAGAVAGITGTTLIYPFDYVKTQLQNSRSSKKSIRSVIHATLQRSGPRGFYRGLLANIVGVTPEKAIKLSMNDLARRWLTTKFGHESNADLPIYLGMFAGAFAGLCQVVATTPMEMVKIQMQLQAKEREPLSTWTMVKRLGLKGMYKGFGATLLRDLPFSMVFFQASALITKAGYNALTAGLFGGALASALVTPLDVIKTRYQAQVANRQSMPLTFTEITRLTWREEGFKAFWKGTLPRVAIISPLFGISLFVYDFLDRIS